MNHFRVITALLVGALLAVSAMASGLAAPVRADTATPPTTVASEEIFAVTFPAETLPTGDAYVDFFRFTAQPGASITWPPGSTPPGVGLDLVVSGSYGVRFDGPMSIVRAGRSPSDATPEAVPAGQEIVADPGDMLIYLDVSSPATFHNPGSEPVVVLSANIISTAIPEVAPPSLPAGIRFEPLATLSTDHWEQVPIGPVTLTLRRMTLEPGMALPPSDESIPTLRTVESGRLSLSTLRPDGATPPGSPLHFSAGQEISYLPLDPGWHIELSNTTDKPCVWLELVIP